MKKSLSHKTLLQFISEANIVHNNKYTYEHSVYIGAREKIKITCRVHGDFEQNAGSHLSGGGCRFCVADVRKIQKRTDISKLLEQFKNIHGDTYLYDKVSYINAHTPIVITCKTHGDFEQESRVHLRGAGCPRCAIIKNNDKQTKPVEQFIIESNIIHINKYDYSKVKYINTMTKVNIRCVKHGVFKQIPDAHLRGAGCPRCKPKDSKAQREINNYVISLGFRTIYGDRILIKPKELDIVIPDKKIAIEYNGLHWHHDKRVKKDYHVVKQRLAMEAGYELLTIFEDEWLLKSEIIKRIIARRLLNKTHNISAYNIGVITQTVTKQFLNIEYINDVPGTLDLCLGYFNETNNLVSVLVLNVIDGDSWNLMCIATNSHFDDGSIEKLFCYFTENYNPSSVLTISDNRLSDNKIYLDLNFEVSKILPIECTYIKSSRRYTKPEIEKITKSIVSNNSKKIWDCGKTEWVWKRNQYD